MYSYRSVTNQDIEVICSHRERMFLEAGHPEQLLALMTQHYRPWMESLLQARMYYGRVAQIDESIVGSIGWMKVPWPPHPMHPEQSERGYVLNLFVEPVHRGKGIARSLMAYVDTEFLGQGIEYCILHSTPMARSMYEKMGWKGTSEMARTRSHLTRKPS
jgi:GNAT superfamily N-acetyltransferase